MSWGLSDPVVSIGAPQAASWGLSDPVASENATPPAAAAPGQNVGQSFLRGMQSSTAGIADAAGGIIGGLPDLVGAGLRMVHPSLAPESPSYYRDTVADALRGVTGTSDFQPEGKVEQMGYGAGKGAANALGFLAPGTALARLGGTAGGVGKAMTVAPGTQVAAAGTGGAVTEATDNPWLGLAASMAVPVGGAVAGRMTAPFPSKLSQMGRDNVARAAKYEIPLTPAQATGSKSLAAVERSFDKSLFTGEMQRDVMGQQHKAFNRALLGTIGQSGDEITPAALDDAAQAIGRKFESLAAQTQVKVDQELFDAVDDISANYLKRLPTNVRPAVESYIDDLNQMRAPLAAGQNPQIDGATYGRIASDLRRAARASGSDPQTEHAIRQLSRAVDDNMERSMGPDVREAYREARNQWRNLLSVEKTMGGSAYAATKAQGDAPYRAFAGTAAKMSGYRGKDDVAELGRIAQFLADQPAQNKVGGIGSAMIANYGLPGLGAMGGAAVGGPIGAIAGGAAGGVSHALLARAYNNPAVQRWLMNQPGAGYQPLGGVLPADIAAANLIAQQRNPR